MYVKSYSILVSDSSLASDNLLTFRKDFLEKKLKLIMTTDNKIRDEKLQYNIKTEAANISALSSENVENMNILQATKYYVLIRVK